MGSKVLIRTLTAAVSLAIIPAAALANSVKYTYNYNITCNYDGQFSPWCGYLYSGDSEHLLPVDPFPTVLGKLKDISITEKERTDLYLYFDGRDFYRGHVFFGSNTNLESVAYLAYAPHNPEDQYAAINGFGTNIYTSSPVINIGLPPGEVASLSRTYEASQTYLQDISKISYNSTFQYAETAYLDIFSADNIGIDDLALDRFTADFQYHRALTFGVEYLYSVPEPSTWAMMVVGFGVIGVFQRQSSRRATFIL